VGLPVKKIIAMLLLAGLLLSGAVGCSDDKDKKAKGTGTGTATGTGTKGT